MTDGYGHWDTSLVGDFDPFDKWEGFIYEITHLPTGRSYIGKKNFFFKKHGRRVESDWRKYTSSCVPLQEALQMNPREHFHFKILVLAVGRCQLTYDEQRIQFECDVLRATLPDGSKRYFNRTINFLNFNGIEKQTTEAKRKIALGNTLDLTGQVFSRLTVLHKENRSVGTGVVWICQCECGNEVSATAAALRCGHVKSCGCLQRDAVAALSKARKGEVRIKMRGKPLAEACVVAMRKKNALPWWTDGIRAIRSADSPGPEWIRGTGNHKPRPLGRHPRRPYRLTSSVK